MGEHQGTSGEVGKTSRLVTFRCSCGGEMKIPENGEGICAQCERHVNLQNVGVSATVSFCQEPGSGQSFQTLDTHDRSGEALGHFRLVSRIGFGGMGSVYSALDESLQRYVAVKVMRSPEESGSHSLKEINRLLDEAVAQARLNHPNVVTIYYVGRKEQEPFLAMELLPGPTLATQVRQGPIDFATIVHYAQQVVSALAHASKMGLVHGDIKPGNLILADQGTVKLSDFGLAKSKHADMSEGISGTLSYMAPELAQGAPLSDQSDMYSLGVTLYELTFGKRPYDLQGVTIREQLDSQDSVQIELPTKLPSSVPRQWGDVMQKLMSKSPKDRYPDYESLQRELNRVAPVGFTSAGLFSRSLAWMVDLSWPMLLMLPMILPSLIYEGQITGSRDRLPEWISNVGEQFRWFALLSPLVPLVITYFEGRGWPTFGHYLFQLRLVDQHGLRLDDRRRLLRSLIRNAPIWLFSIGAVLNTLGFSLLATLMSPVDDIVFLINTIPVLGRKRLAMHDRLVSSRVVLDTKAGQ